jgi:RimJ/RimL family protein N-acetyltransferase
MDEPIASTDRLTLRRWQVSEACRFLSIYQSEEVWRWIGGRPLESVEAAEVMIRRNLARTDADKVWGTWAISEHASPDPAGSVVLTERPGGTEMMLGWHLHPDSWGRGLASEAAAALMKFAFSVGHREVVAFTEIDNDRSAAVCRRLAMRELGVSSRVYPQPHRVFWASVDDSAAAPCNLV